MSESMLCVSCGHTRQYPDGFPNRTYAECWGCAWDYHIHKSHPGVVRRVKRAAKKRARARAERDIFVVMFEREKRQVLGVPGVLANQSAQDGLSRAGTTSVASGATGDVTGAQIGAQDEGGKA